MLLKTLHAGLLCLGLNVPYHESLCQYSSNNFQLSVYLIVFMYVCFLVMSDMNANSSVVLVSCREDIIKMFIDRSSMYGVSIHYIWPLSGYQALVLQPSKVLHNGRLYYCANIRALIAVLCHMVFSVLGVTPCLCGTYDMYVMFIFRRILIYLGVHYMFLYIHSLSSHIVTDITESI